MKKTQVNQVKKEFFLLTHIPPLHGCNRVEDRLISRDVIFERLGEKVYDMPGLLDLLAGKLPGWLKVERSEFTCFLAGCVYYFQEDYPKAEKYFLESVRLNPRNLDNFLALAFSRYHQEGKKRSQAMEMFFNYDTLEVKD